MSLGIFTFSIGGKALRIKGDGRIYQTSERCSRQTRILK